MRKEHLISIVVLAILLVAVALYVVRYASRQNRMAQTTQSTASATQTGIQSTQATLNQADNTGKYKVAIVYPQFSGFTNSQTQDQVNNSIKALMQSQADAFIKGVNATQQSSSMPQFMRDAQSEFTTQYTVAQASNKVISVVFTVFNSTAGMAHPDTTYLTFNYDVAANKQLQLADVFKPGSNYLQTISSMAQKQLLDQQKDNPNAKALVDQGTTAKADNFALFSLEPTNLVLLFNPAQVAPRVNGPMKVTIPYKDIATITNQNLVSQ